MRLLSYLISELKHSHRFVLFFIFNLCIGLSGFIALDGFKSSIDHTMKKKSRQVLGADLSLSARRPLESKEVDLVFKNLPVGSVETEVVELYSMVQFPNGSTRLVKIKAVSENYPFYGGVRVRSHYEIQSNFDSLLKSNSSIWVFSELMAQGDLNIGSQLKIGEATFLVDQVIVDDTTSGMGASFAPTIYMSVDSLKKTNLIRKGSVAWHSRLYQLPPSTHLEALTESLFRKIPSQDIRLTTHTEASAQVGRLLQSLNDYLGLAAVVALFLAAVGTGFLFRSYFQRKIQEVAILVSLGLTKTQASFYYFTQIVLLGLMSVILALILSFFLVPMIHALTSEFLPFEFEYVLTLKTVIVSLFVGVFGSLFICLPFLGQLKKIQPVVLLSESIDLRATNSVTSKNSYFEYRFIFLCLPGFLMFWGLSVWQASSLVAGTVFVGAFLSAGVVLIVCGSVALKLIEKIQIRPRRWIALQWALRDLARERLTSISCFLALGLGAVLLNLIPQVQESLEYELSSPKTSKLPSLFMFDIQEDQLAIVQAVFDEAGVELTQVSPMIQSRLISVNNEEFDKGKGAGQGLSREEEREMRFRNRGFNLSYRDGLSESETLHSGQPLVGRFEESSGMIPGISMEKRFARRLNLKIGDFLKFEIEGVPVEGKIVNLRSVRWTSFQPNFFIQFQPGVLEMAPKTFIATSEAASESIKVRLQRDLVEKAPNVSIIDVTRLVEKISAVVRQMGLALQTMAILCLISGFVVIFSILSHQMEKKRWQIGLKKVLGADYKVIQRYIYLQYLILAMFSAFLGVTVSVVFSYILSQVLFESVWVFSWKAPLFSTLLIFVITLGVIFVSSKKYLRQTTKSLLNVS